MYISQVHSHAKFDTSNTNILKVIKINVGKTKIAIKCRILIIFTKYSMALHLSHSKNSMVAIFEVCQTNAVTDNV